MLEQLGNSALLMFGGVCQVCTLRRRLVEHLSSDRFVCSLLEQMGSCTYLHSAGIAWRAVISGFQCDQWHACSDTLEQPAYLLPARTVGLPCKTGCWQYARIAHFARRPRHVGVFKGACPHRYLSKQMLNTRCMQCISPSSCWKYVMHRCTQQHVTDIFMCLNT